jgi:ribosome biogenesis GTPase / thiamine phosphate phosphatase
MAEIGPSATLEELGWRDSFARRAGEVSAEERIGRVAVEHRGAYEVIGPDGTQEAAVAPEFRRAVDSPLEFPGVGDWVVHTESPRHDRRVEIVRVIDRESEAVRRAPGPDAVPQLVGANIDTLAIVTTPLEDLNERRLERYLALAHGGGITPVIVVNKADLGGEVEAQTRVASRFSEVPILIVSAVTGDGIDQLRDLLAGPSTLAFTGSSGVGKSALVNRLMGTDDQEIGDVREDGRGRHTTIRRHLLLIPGGGVVIDTPGLREVRLWDAGGLDATFPDLAGRAADCRFADCQHRGEPGCAVEAAVIAGDVDASMVAAYRTLIDELIELEIEIEERERILQRRIEARGRARRNSR